MLVRKVFIKFSKTGLGNLMLIWARGVVFAKLNNLEYICSSWWGVRGGPIIRRELKKRLYWGYFKESALWKKLIIQLYTGFISTEYDPPLENLYLKDAKSKIYVFDEKKRNEDLFYVLRDHHALIAGELYNILAPKLKMQLQQYEAPTIGIHIRRGDFKISNQVTPLQYFINAINLVRTTIGKVLPVTIFTDAKKDELAEVLALENISISENKADILDIFLLSKSRIIVLSQSSTFSYWAAFLSDALVIRPFDWQNVIRNPSANSNYVEIKWNYDDLSSTTQVTEAIKKIDNF